MPALEDCTAPCARGGGENSSSWTSLGTMMQVGERVVFAIRMARSTR